MNTMINNTIETVKAIISENRDIYFPIFDDSYFIVNTDDQEKRMIFRAVAMLLSYERDRNGKILMIGNKDVSTIEEGLSGIREYLKGKGFDPELISSNIQISDISDINTFREETKNEKYSLIILENAEAYEVDDDVDISERLKAISSLHADRALITAKEDYDPGYEDPEDKDPDQIERGKYEGCGGDVFYNPGYTEYKGVLNAVMDALLLKPDDTFRKTLMDDDQYIRLTGSHMFSLDRGDDISGAFENPGGLYNGAFESYANNSDIFDRKELYVNFLRCAQKYPLIRESRYLLNNYSIYDLPSLTDKDRLMELLSALLFSDDEKDRIIANYEKYAL